MEDLLAEGRSLLAAGAGGRGGRAAGGRRGPSSGSPPVLDIDDGAAAAEIRSRWVTRRQEVRDELLGARLASGEHRAVLPDLEEAVAEQPYDEGLRAKLVIALYRSGRQRDALQALQDARRVLADEVGVEPGPELRRLEAAVLDQASDLDWVAPPPTPSRAGSPPRPVAEPPPSRRRPGARPAGGRGRPCRPGGAGGRRRARLRRPPQRARRPR